MKTLKCGANWRSGSADGEWVATDFMLIPFALHIAEALAMSKAWKELTEFYGTPCPSEEDDDCPNKGGLYAIKTMSRAMENTPAGTKVNCRVDWVVKVVCDKRAIAAPGPLSEDFEKLWKEYDKSLPHR